MIDPIQIEFPRRLLADVESQSPTLELRGCIREVDPVDAPGPVAGAFAPLDGDFGIIHLLADIDDVLERGQSVTERTDLPELFVRPSELLACVVVVALISSDCTEIVEDLCFALSVAEFAFDVEASPVVNAGLVVRPSVQTDVSLSGLDSRDGIPIAVRRHGHLQAGAELEQRRERRSILAEFENVDCESFAECRRVVLDTLQHRRVEKAAKILSVV